MHELILRPFSGTEGSKSWPDLDMLPFGVITSPNTPTGAIKNTSLTHAMQRTQMTLWAVAQSPLMFGGVVTALDTWTLGLLTNPTVLAINSHGTALNKPVPLMSGSSDSCYAWQAQGTSKPGGEDVNE